MCHDARATGVAKLLMAARFRGVTAVTRRRPPAARRRQRTALLGDAGGRLPLHWRLAVSTEAIRVW